jgi:hypothetical protein
MEKFVRGDRELVQLFQRPNAEWVLSPNTVPDGKENASRSLHHGDFDNDASTLRATLARILGARTDRSSFTFHRSASSASRLRRELA